MTVDPRGASARLKVVDVAALDSVDDAGGPVVAVGSGEQIRDAAAQAGLERATFTLTQDEVADRRVVTVASVDTAVAELQERVGRWPQAAAICDDVLRSVQPDAPAVGGVVTESLAYSTLQSGPEFKAWLAERGPASAPIMSDPVLVERQGDSLRICLNRPARHNAFSTDMRQALLEALTIAWLDDTVAEVILAGRGPSFCSGGDLAEFGSFDNPVAAHFARTRHSPALLLDRLSARLGERLIARVHGQVLGSGLEMAAFCGRLEAHAASRFGLPELSLGLIPGAGGTVSVTRRIGRWRTAYLVLSGRTIDAETGRDWGLVDTVTPVV